jgi:hypothetical protein
MLTDSQNKMQTPDEIKATSIKAVSPSMNEYHFPGAGIYKPMSVRAANIEAATLIYEKQRVRISPEPEAQPDTKPEEKVEEAKPIELNSQNV